MSMPTFEGSTRHLAIGMGSLVVGVLPALVVGAMTGVGPAILTAVVCGLLGFFLSRQAEERGKEEDRRVARQHEQSEQHRKKLAQAEREARAAKHRMQIERDRQQAEQNAFASIRALVSQTASAYLTLPMLVEEIERDYLASKQQFSDGAFSPFWSSIEQAYNGLGHFSHNVVMIAEAASAFPEQVQSYIGSYGSEETLPQFPVDLEAGSVLEVAKTLSSAISDLVYVAQKEPVFAQIWEQRRTTAAVVEGFGTLDQAIGRMTYALSGQIKDLNGSLSNHLLRVTESIDDSTRAIVSGDDKVADKISEAASTLATLERRSSTY